MSNATDTPKKQGQRRRRRRGGRNRNNSQSNNNDQSNRSQGGNKDGGRPRRRRSPRKPIPLSWWQKALIAIGLYEDPNKRKGKPKSKSADKETSSKSASRTPKSNTRPPKSNTRNARSKDDGERPMADSTSKRATRERKRQGGDPSTVKSNRVYVGNLSYDVTEQDLKELFKGVGTVRAVEIVYNRNTHRSKGYGFVDMMNKDDAIRSVEVLHDQPFMGRNMTVSGANNRPEGDDEDNEPAMEIKASDVELAPLPEQKSSEPEAEPAAESVEPGAEEAAELNIEEAPASEAPAESESPEKH